MILANGKIYDSSEQDGLLAGLELEINDTLSDGNLDREVVITAIDCLGQKIAEGEFTDRIKEFLPENEEGYLVFVAEAMSRKSLNYRVETELGKDLVQDWEIQPPYGISKGRVSYVPLGTLFHIAAGNMDGLPAFSVIEGLLTGNINILKLPQADNGLTIAIFKELIAIEPRLARYIYVFDTPSSDITAMQKMARMADGIVVWGGEEAVKAVRTLAPAGAKLIEWGHKLGFAYVSGYGEVVENGEAAPRNREKDMEEELKALAKHIMDTRQLLCSSCQVIFLDTEDMDKVYGFCEEFLPYLEAAAEENPITEIGAVAELSLRRYTEQLERILGDSTKEKEEKKENPERKIFQGSCVSVTACADHNLELSYMYGNVLVKPLPEEKLLSELRQSKGYLQTAGLICPKEHRERLTDKLIRCGVNRVMSARNMSATFSGEAHDGEYPLRRYLRVVNVEE